MRLRTAFLDHGYHVTVFHAVARNYLRGWLVPDALSAIPFDRIVAACIDPRQPDRETIVNLVRLLRVLRFFRLVRLLKLRHCRAKAAQRHRRLSGHALATAARRAPHV